jgi:hypothetical protein
MNIANHEITIRPAQETPRWKRRVIMGCLVALGCFYLGTWLFFKLYSTDFIVAQRQTLLEQRRQTPASYRLNTLLNFAGNPTSAATQYQLRGWSYPEAWGAWTDGSEAELAMRLIPELSHPLIVNVGIQSAIHSPEQPVQQVEIIANDQAIEDWSIQSSHLPANRVFTIPAPMLNKNGILRLVFRIRHPISPKTLGGSNDTRQLGIGIHHMLITEKL